MGDPTELEGVFHGSDNVGLPDHIIKLLGPPSSGNNGVTHGLKPSSEPGVRSSERLNTGFACKVSSVELESAWCAVIVFISGLLIVSFWVRLLPQVSFAYSQLLSFLTVPVDCLLPTTDCF